MRKTARVPVRGADVSKLFVPLVLRDKVEWYATVDENTGEMRNFFMIGGAPEVTVGDDE